MRNYGSRIKKAREAAGLTQDQLGKEIGVTGVTIMRYEKNQREPRIEQLEKIAKVLDISIFDFIDGGQHMKPSEIQQSMKLDDYLLSMGYEFFYEYKDYKDSWLCVDNKGKKLYILSRNDVSTFEKSLHDFTKFQISELLKNGKEIPDTEGWFTPKKETPPQG